MKGYRNFIPEIKL